MRTSRAETDAGVWCSFTKTDKGEKGREVSSKRLRTSEMLMKNNNNNSIFWQICLYQGQQEKTKQTYKYMQRDLSTTSEKTESRLCPQMELQVIRSERDSQAWNMVSKQTR